MYVALEAAMMSMLVNTVNHCPESTCRASAHVRITRRGFPGELLALASSTMVATTGSYRTWGRSKMTGVG